ncbi:hypothetical protein BRD09_08790 [Halobacteriales archaeon SW_10_68_16]|nr:MAG: hypothetical protein BRD09_08790 [Halobacteriales archaeon SW_10_68_16]
MRVVLVALAVALAGCPAVGPAATPTPEPEEYPPGVSGEGVVDATTLADAHDRAIENTSYTLVSNRTVRYTNGTVASALFVRVELAADRSFFVRTSTAGPDGPEFLGKPPAAGEFWSNGTVYVRAQEGHARETIASVFADVPTEVTGVRTVDGTTVYRLAGEGTVEGDFSKAGSDAVGNVSLTAQVTESGILRRMDLSYVTFLAGQSVRVEWTVRYDDVGTTTVERPSWFDRAVAENASA